MRRGFTDNPAMPGLRRRAGDLLVDPGLQKVERGGVAIELPQLSFELLVALMDAAPRYVSNDALMQQVWKGLVVSPETVTQRVKLLRDALGDDPRNPRYIDGLRGRGYRLLVPVTDEAAVEIGPGTAAASPATRRHQIRAALAGVLLVGLVAGLAWWAREGREEPALPVSASRTVAILPFSTESPAQEKAATGLTDSILSQLAQVRDLRVISPLARSAADEAGPDARYLVGATVQQRDGRLRVAAHVFDDRGDVQVWAQVFERPEAEAFALQDEVADAVRLVLQSRIAEVDPTVPRVARSANPEAQLSFLRGRALLGRTTVSGAVDAEREFQRAAALDPEFVPALLGIYDARLEAAKLRRAGMDETLTASQPLLAKAQAMDPDSGGVLLARAMWSIAAPADRVKGFEEGLRKDPSNVRAMVAYADLLQSMDRDEEAARWLDRAVEVDPHYPPARFRQAQRHFPAVGSSIEQQTLRVLELVPDYYPALQRLSKYRWMSHGDIAQALAIIERAIAMDPDNPWGITTAIVYELDLDDPSAAEALARRNPVSDASTRALRAQYRGDWRAAGEAARQPGSYVVNPVERWGVTTSLRDEALRTQRYDATIALLSDRYRLPLAKPWQLIPMNFREALLLSHLLLASGQREEGLRRLDELIAWIDANGHLGPVFNLRTKANALQLKGETDEALKLLAESFQQGDYTHWWYALKYDPVWDPVRADPRFVAIASRVRAHVDGEMRALARLRAEDAVPPPLPEPARSTGTS